VSSSVVSVLLPVLPKGQEGSDVSWVALEVGSKRSWFLVSTEHRAEES